MTLDFPNLGYFHFIDLFNGKRNYTGPDVPHSCHLRGHRIERFLIRAKPLKGANHHEASQFTDVAAPH
jgi:hypothetical protein